MVIEGGVKSDAGGRGSGAVGAVASSDEGRAGGGFARGSASERAGGHSQGERERELVGRRSAERVLALDWGSAPIPASARVAHSASAPWFQHVCSQDSAPSLNRRHE